MDLTDYASCKDRFQAEDADIELECAPATSTGTDTGTTLPSFKVHVHQLAAVSPVLAVMLAVSDSSTVDGDSKAVRLQKVRIEETWRVIYCLLGYAYNKEGIMGGLMKTTDPNVVLEVYEAARKYQMHGLAALASTVL